MITSSVKSKNPCKSVIQITDDIVKAHGGELKVESPPSGEAGEVGGGTVFIFYLPINP